MALGSTGPDDIRDRALLVDVATVLLHVLIVLVAAKVGAEASERLGQPAVLGELILGMVIGPSALGLVGHDAVLDVLAELGVLLLLMQVGLETELADLLRVGRVALLVAVVGVVLPFAFAYLYLRPTGMAGSGHHEELLVAATLTATSVGITARVFGDLGALSRAEARTVLGAAVIDDVIGLLILTVIVRLLGGGRISPAGVASVVGIAVGFLVVGVVAGVRLAPPLFHWIERRARSEGTVIGLALAFALGFALLADVAGLAAIVGAFVAGTVLARSRTSGRIGASLAPIAHVFVPVFFLKIGIDADLGALLRPRALLLALVLFAVATVGKVLAGAATSGTGMDRLLVGLGMLPRGEVGLIFASIGLRLGAIDQSTYGALLLVILATTFVTPPLLRWRLPERERPEPVTAPASATRARGELVVRDGWVELSGTPAPGSQSRLGLLAARLAAVARPGPRLLDWLASAGREPVTWTSPLRQELFAMLQAATPSSWRFLEETGLLSRYLPELARARAERRARQGDRPWHRFCALTRLAEPSHDPTAAAVWLSLTAPEPVLLAGLTRAVAGHAQPTRTVAVARATAKRLGLGAGDEQAIALLIGEDLDLAEVAVHTDLHDEEQVLTLAARFGTPDRARMAYLLALAEQDDGDSSWEGWRRPLLDELLHGILAAMVEPGLTDRAAENLLNRRRAEVERALNGRASTRAAALLAAAPRRYLLAHPAEVIAGHLALAEPPPGQRELRLAIAPEPGETPAHVRDARPGAWRVDVVARDRPGLLAGLVGALSACGVDITRAQASTWPDGLAVDTFHVAGPMPAADPGFPQRVEHMLRHLVTGDLDPSRLLAGRRPVGAPDGSGPVLVRVDADASPWHSTIQVEAPDRPGLLYHLVHELARRQIDVQLARINGDNGRALDVFYVTDAAGNPLTRTAADRLSTVLANAISAGK